MFAKELRLQPDAVLQRLKDATRGEFEALYEDELLLLVSLARDGEAIKAALMENAAVEGSAWMVRSDVTGTGTSLWTPAFRPLTPEPAAEMGYLGFRKILRTEHFVIPLQKRSGSQVSDVGMISAGRSHHNDIVLRHKTVSKLHAFFERADDGTLYVRDTGSTNGTRIEGRRLQKHALEHFREGTEVKLGDVAVRVCKPGVLWDAFRKKI